MASFARVCLKDEGSDYLTRHRPVLPGWPCLAYAPVRSRWNMASISKAGLAELLALARHYDEPVASASGVYRARVYGRVLEDGRWGGWLVFFPAGGGRVAATDRETSQSGFADLAYWASGLTHAYLEGALERALALQPEAEL